MIKRQMYGKLTYVLKICSTNPSVRYLSLVTHLILSNSLSEVIGSRTFNFSHKFRAHFAVFALKQDGNRNPEKVYTVITVSQSSVWMEPEGLSPISVASIDTRNSFLIII